MYFPAMTYAALAPGLRRSLVRSLEAALRSVDNRAHQQNDPIGDAPAVRAQNDAAMVYERGWASREHGRWSIDLDAYMRSPSPVSR